MKKLLLILLCLPMIGFGQVKNNKSTFNFNKTNDYSKKEKNESLTPKHNVLNGKVKSVLNTCYYAKLIDGEIINGNTISKSKQLFDKEGIQTEHITLYDNHNRFDKYGNIIGRSKFQKDKYGNTIKLESFDKDGTLKNTSTYDNIIADDGRLIEQVTYFNGELSNKKKYGDDMKLIEQTNYFNGFEVSTMKSNYNDEGQLIGSTSFDKDGNIIVTSNIEYNTKGMLKGSATYNSKGETISTMHLYWEYDEKLNWIKEIEYKNNILSKITERNIEYYSYMMME